MRRMFTLAVGIGAGAAAAILVSRWVRRQRQAVSPRAIASQAGSAARDLAALVRESMAEGRKAMAAREAEIRSRIPG